MSIEDFFRLVCKGFVPEAQRSRIWQQYASSPGVAELNNELVQQWFEKVKKDSDHFLDEFSPHTLVLVESKIRESIRSTIPGYIPSELTVTANRGTINVIYSPALTEKITRHFSLSRLPSRYLTHFAGWIEHNYRHLYKSEFTCPH